MTTITDNIASYYLTQAYTAHNQVINLQNEINAGKATLTPTQQAKVTKLSNQAIAYETANSSISSAQNVIGVAQTGLSSIQNILHQMQLIANEASGTTDSSHLNSTFQSLLRQIGTLATSASVNGVNLLSGTSGLYVQTGINGTPSSRSWIQSVNVYGMITTGALSGVQVDTPEHAQNAINSLMSIVASVTNGQSYLQIMNKNLNAQANASSKLAASDQSQIASMQNINVPALQTQLAILKSQQKTDTILAKKFGATIPSNLTIVA